MELIFEDRRGCVLDEILKLVYSEEDYNHIHFKGTNGEAVKFACNKVEQGETVILFLDMVPGNYEIHQLYNKAKEVSKKNNYKLLIIPSLCSEYLLIKAFKDCDIFINREDVKICLEQNNYFESKLYVSDKTRKDYKTFEKFCKLVLERNTINCACSNSRVKIQDYKYIKNIVKNMFYTNDCLYKDSTGKYLSAMDKALKVVNTLPVTLLNDNVTESASIDLETAWKIHKYLINELNKFVLKMKSSSEIGKLCIEFESVC